MRFYASCGVVSFFFLLFFPSFAFAQGESLFRVDTDTVSVGEFLYAYKKNRGFAVEGTQLSLDVFLRSYVDFRLKVADAHAVGLDTLTAFRQEYKRYRDYQIAPYFLDSAVRDSVYRETYSRMQREVDASHILLAVKEPEEEALVLERAQALRREALSGAVSFDSLARVHSDDPSAKENGGRLGYFGAFTMVYPFEIAAFNTPVGTISEPIRTQFGYHLVRVNASRASRGQMRVAHIMRLLPHDAAQGSVNQAVRFLDSLRGELANGADFAELARTVSEDRGSAQRGGVLPPVSVARFPDEFVDAAFALQHDGELSQVVRTSFGVHLILRLEHLPLADYESSKETIRTNLSRVGVELEGEAALRRSFLHYSGTSVRESALEKLMMFYTRSAEAIPTVLPDSLAHERFAQVGDKKLTLDELHSRILGRSAGENLDATRMMEAVEALVGEWAERIALERLRHANPELAYLLNEFYSGLLLFDISERRLWSVEVNTEEALRSLYAKRKRDLRFRTCVTVEEYSGDDSLRLVAFREFLRSGASGRAVRSRLASDSIHMQTRNYESDVPLLVGYRAAATLEEPSATMPSSLRWEGACSEMVKRPNGKCVFYRVVGERTGVRKSFDEARGELQVMHQAELERQWLERLRTEHEVEVFNQVFSRLKQEVGR